jgi:hypothetical protein
MVRVWLTLIVVPREKSMNVLLLSFALVLMFSPVGRSGEVERLGHVEFKGDIHKAKNVSAITVVKGYLVVGSDEGNTVQILKPDGDRYTVLPQDVILDGHAKEIDIEGIAAEGDLVYVVGSHSRVRKTVDDQRSAQENRQRLLVVERDESRERLYRFRLDGHGEVSALEVTSLMPVIEQDPVLQAFTRVPSKENGVDIEGIAVRDGRLYIGFRGPVLRDNYVPVLRARFGNPVSDASLLFVNLGGRGIRDLAPARNGLLILAGPVGDGPGSYQLYFWDGHDCLPGQRRPGELLGRLELLGKIATEGEAKAEGVTVLEESDKAYEVLIVFDGLKDGGAMRYRVMKP